MAGRNSIFVHVKSKLLRGEFWTEEVHLGVVSIDGM